MTEWHLDTDDIDTYLRAAGDLARTASAETHLLACASCRARLATVSAQARPTALDAAWERLTADVDRPSRLRRLPGSDRLRLVVGAPALARATLLAAAVVGVAPVVLSTVSGRGGLLLLLLLAPLAPMAGVVVAFRAGHDPAGEMSLAAPVAGLRLVALRALVVCAVAVPCALAGFVAVGGLGGSVPAGLTTAWLLPGAALAGTTFAAGTTRLDPLAVATTLAALWTLAVLTVASAGSDRPGFDLSATAELVAASSTQAVALAVAVAAAAVSLARREAVVYRRAL
ncbi:hypothetical protein [Nocardioides sp. J54]|uniref:hypothetical protein n=1 Tax=Nocardioides sp. J54 TaxID=935866 RepID=UPI0004ADED8A|nr:hypothetical protein [Nocardioides sp. J54]